MVTPRRFEVWGCQLDPVVGREIGKTRPGVIVSPDVANAAVSWCTVAPMTTGRFAYAACVPTTFDGREATIIVDQLRCLDRRRLIRPMGMLDEDTQARLLDELAAFFAR